MNLNFLEHDHEKYTQNSSQEGAPLRTF